MPTVIGKVSKPGEVGVLGESDQFEGVRGISHAANHGGIVGINDDPSDTAGPGVYGESKKGQGVRGISYSPLHGGVVGTNQSQAPGVYGESILGEGVRGVSHSPNHGGVVGICDNEAAGVYGESVRGEGVVGVSNSAVHAAMVATNRNAGGIGILGQGGRAAGRFEGNVEVTGDMTLKNALVEGDITLLNAADCAEEFDVADEACSEPGTVMVLDDEGCLRQSAKAYDRRVAGVVSGAGEYKPGIVLHRQPSRHDRRPIALIGKVYCKVDSQYGAIEVGDLLTTSATPGHAMKASEPASAFGAVIGKALQPLSRGQQKLIPILVALQ